MHLVRHLKTLFVVLAITSLAACEVSVIGEHEPMHPVDRPVHLRAVASGDVSKIEIWVGSSHVNANGNESTLTPLTLMKTCNPSGAKDTVTCRHTMPQFADYTMVDFRVVAYGPMDLQDAETYRFAAGKARFPGEPIPIRVKSDDVLNTLDVVMIRDLDMPRGFLSLIP